jgi:DNA polymerase (family X)
MQNKDVVKLLEEIALLLELAGESPFKSRAYTNVARQIEQSDEDVETLVRENRLRDIKGVGDALEQKITEFVSTGKLAYRDKLRSQFPESLFEIMGIPGLGPKRVKQLYSENGIDSLEKLEKACNDGSLSDLKGFGKKMAEKVLEGIAFARDHANQFLYNLAWNEAQRVVALLKDVESVSEANVAGSLRRHKEVVKDLDVVVASTDAAQVMTSFVEDENVERVTNHGDTKSSVILRSGIAADLRVVAPKEYPYALLHFTGSKEHNVVLRQRAKDRGLKLNEYGLFKGEKLLPCKSEADIYKKLDLPYIPPEMREDMGEFDVNPIPVLVEMDDLKGVIHCHSKYSDGQNTIEEMALAAKERGYSYMVVSDHSQSAAYAGGLKPDKVKKQHKEIDALNGTLGRFKVLKGIESDIKRDGALDYSDAVLATFEVVIASVHAHLTMDEDEATDRIVKAVEHPETNILGHPTGRLLLQREGYPLNYERVFDACAANQVAIEINANCRRLDLDWRHVRRAKERGVMLCISPDAHRIPGLDDVQYGVGIARKGWLEPADLLNTMTAAQLLKWCAK